MSRTLRGRVHHFDRDRGLGVVRTADGVDYRFHCIEIADGSRDVATGTAVFFVVRDRFGRREAARLTAC